jgi:hypothetical protein
MKSISFSQVGPAIVTGLGLLLVVVTGCGPGQGKVSGQALLDGAPLPGGRLTFRPADPRQNSVSAELDEQGRYEVLLPAGLVQVSIDNRELESRGNQSAVPPIDGLPPNVLEKLRGGAKSDSAQCKPVEDALLKLPGKYVVIPNRYYDLETSGLEFTVQRGDQNHDIILMK